MKYSLASQLLLFITAATCSAFLLIQQESGTIRGLVTDPGGIELPGVQVVITSQDSGASRTVMTSEEGLYQVQNLTPGRYQVTATRPLYKKTELFDQVLSPSETLIVDLVLNMGDMSEVAVQPGTGSLLEAAGLAGGKSFYIDSENGNDANAGDAEERAWKSLEKVNSYLFGPGDRILFKAGTRFRGQLRPRGSGSRQKPIIIGMYGEGGKPLIEAEGRFDAALLLRNQDYWEVNNLELTNRGPQRKRFRNGVRVLAENHGTMKHIHLKDLWVHDVNGSLKKGKGEGYGILLETGGDDVRSRFDGLLVQDCHLERTDRNGICGLSSYRPKDVRAFPSLNVLIRRNLLEDIGGDGIKIWGCKGALVEHNVIRGARTRCDDYAAGIWPWASDETIIQFNEVSGVKGKKDGQAFDSDAYTTNTLFQYNYSHDNEGGFMLICCFDNRGTVVRYNISQNDQTRTFHMAGSNEDIQIYNNVFYIGKGLDVHLFLWTGRAGNWTRDVQISNNVFYVDGVGRISSGEKRKEIGDGTFITRPGFGGSSEILFEKNVLYGTFQDIPEAWKTMTSKPGLVAPGTGGEGLLSAGGYKLKDGSPLIGAGNIVPANGGQDFWGNPVSAGTPPSIGVHEHQ